MFPQPESTNLLKCKIWRLCETDNIGLEIRTVHQSSEMWDAAYVTSLCCKPTFDGLLEFVLTFTILQTGV